MSAFSNRLRVTYITSSGLFDRLHAYEALDPKKSCSLWYAGCHYMIVSAFVLLPLHSVITGFSVFVRPQPARRHSSAPPLLISYLSLV